MPLINSPTLLGECERVLKSGGVILCPTDTVYGLLCDATKALAVEKIYRIKKRSLTKKLAIFAASVNQIQALCKVNFYQTKVLSNLLPGEFTFILGTNQQASQSLLWLEQYGEKSLGVRIPAHHFLLKLLASFPNPIAATSANLSSGPDSAIFDEIHAEIKAQVDLCIEDANPSPKEASCVIDLRGFEPPGYNFQVLRTNRFSDKFIDYIKLQFQNV